MSLLRKKKENLVAVELIATDVVRNVLEGKSPTWHPFYQITNAQGHVLARSKVLVDCRSEDAYWPVVRITWEDLFLACKINCSASSIANSEDTSFQEAVLTQPLLFTMYGFKGNCNHTVYGQVQTSLQDLMDKANHLASSHTSRMLVGLHHKEPSYWLQRGGAEIMGHLYVKQVKSSSGSDPILSEKHFSPQPTDQGRLPNLTLTAPPPGLPARRAPNDQPKLSWINGGSPTRHENDTHGSSSADEADSGEIMIQDTEEARERAVEVARRLEHRANQLQLARARRAQRIAREEAEAQKLLRDGNEVKLLDNKHNVAGIQQSEQALGTPLGGTGMRSLPYPTVSCSS